MPLNFLSIVTDFFDVVGKGGLDVYNEFSLQHEFGAHLRSLPQLDGYKIQFERPAEFFGIRSDELLKKEIDVSVFSPDLLRKFAIEFKFPRNGQYPEQMFSVCRDIAFLEELVQRGFDGGLFIMSADQKPFYEGQGSEGIYKYFRGGCPLSGVITKPTGKQSESIAVHGTYQLRWQRAGVIRWLCLEVGNYPLAVADSAKAGA